MPGQGGYGQDEENLLNKSTILILECVKNTFGSNYMEILELREEVKKKLEYVSALQRLVMWMGKEDSYPHPIPLLEEPQTIHFSSPKYGDDHSQIWDSDGSHGSGFYNSDS
ncbi:uncharacterized protein PGTG_00722 [Puccinia graminis f. sp. tritici CRL 75-36-700-3]|uniref:Uncharacterized protein n=1 Tax=Puccinia graminis f. sp. tritici (strain CRL 75-36-700-3 / race SCCL) TaxID=418459 RepID=E3JRM7_PUCGT|nr:uncharacterized protein PGTG_00722 [Puccinia graminis f. sp. tritici CRL 75-36-700-3]EFP74766.1 hypothetical protein PGTG_00722 [Puccinia graminis f. sp. tritici CRL 75-36-700-3]